MKNELVNFLLEHPDLSWEISGKTEEILLKAIDEFFNSYQPERLSEEALKGCDSPNTPTKGSEPNRND